MKINDMQSIFVVVVICYFDDLPCAHTLFGRASTHSRPFVKGKTIGSMKMKYARHAGVAQAKLSQCERVGLAGRLAGWGSEVAFNRNMLKLWLFIVWHL